MRNFRKDSVAEKIKEMASKDPDITPEEVVEELGCHPDYAQYMLCLLGVAKRKRIKYGLVDFKLPGPVPGRCDKCGGVVVPDRLPYPLGCGDENRCIICGKRFYGVRAA